ncbi:MAG: T9SS type A sorting domain-containing protein [Alphaproteobacteria bacterium]|nr:T9SS type A sorting domain-containing protein [Alphaproteobacteria bacterium]
MKTHILLFSFLCIFTFCAHAQAPQRHAFLPAGFERIDSYFNPTQPGFKPDKMVIPAKRNMFNPSSSVWKWDTILCYKTTGSEPFYRITRKYNSSGDSLVQLMELIQSNLIYVNSARESFTFDSAGNWLSYLSEKWENNAWVNQLTKKFVYNSNGDMVDWKTTYWENNRWMNGWHYYWHFDANGLNDTSLYQDGLDSLWVNNELCIQSYDTNGYATSAVVSSWINNGWALFKLVSYTNNSNGDLLTCLRQVWENSSWVNSSLSTMTYDTAGNRLSGLYQLWLNNAWENNSLSSYLYDGNGNKILDQNWDWSGGSWSIGFRYVYLYDTRNNMLSQTSQNWINSSWQNGDMQHYTYDTLGNSLTGKYLHWYGGWQPYDGGLSVFSNYQWDVYAHAPGHRYKTVLDSILVFTEPGLKQEQVTLYPNPSHSMIYISSPAASAGSQGSLTLYDLRGQLVLTKPLVNETTGIDISGLNPGVYFVRFSGNRMTRIMKLVKD